MTAIDETARTLLPHPLARLDGDAARAIELGRRLESSEARERREHDAAVAEHQQRLEEIQRRHRDEREELHAERDALAVRLLATGVSIAEVASTLHLSPGEVAWIAEEHGEEPVDLG